MLNKLVFENLKHRPVRTLLSVLAIGVEVTMMLTLVGVSEGTLHETARRARGVGAEIIVRPPGSSIINLSSAPMDDRLLQVFAKLPHVKMSTGAVVNSLGGFDTLTGIDLNEFNSMSGGFRYLSGGPFQSPDDILVDEFYAKQNKLSVGDKKELMGHMWRVSGIVEPGKLGRIFCALNVLQDLTANTHKVSVIYIKMKPGEEQFAQQLVDQLRAQMPKYGIYTVEEFASMISIDSVGVLKAFIYVVVGIAVVVGFIVVFMAMYTAVLERTREIGILKALGASPATIVNVLIRETILIAIIGSIVGILLSYVTRFIIGTLIPSTLVQEIVPPWWGISGAIAISGALLGALYPGLKAARQDAIEALSYE